MVGVLVVGLSARAHPMQSGLAGHRIRLTVHADAIEAEVLIEEPVPWVLRDLRNFLDGVQNPTKADQERYTLQRLAEFESGLQLYVDGERRSWEALAVGGPNGVAEGEFVVYKVFLRAPLDPARSDLPLHVLDLNHVGEKVARYVEVWGTWETDLRGCSLWTDGEVDWSGRWRVGDQTAEVRLTRRTRHWLSARWARLRLQTDDPVRVGPEGLPFGQLSSWWWWGAALLLLLLGGRLAVIVRYRSVSEDHL